MSPWSDGCLGLFIAPSAFFEVAFFAFFKPPLIRLILTPLDRSSFSISKKYGTQKSNSQIKSYGSRKFALQRSILHPSFCDISVVLTPISTYEQSLKWEWCWFQLVLAAGSKFDLQVNLSQTWSNLLKISEKLEFGVKLWKTLFCGSLDIVWSSVNPRAD